MMSYSRLQTNVLAKFDAYYSTSSLVTRQARNQGGICPPEIFKILHSNFDICRNFQRIKMKFYILIIFKKSYLHILFLSR